MAIASFLEEEEEEEEEEEVERKKRFCRLIFGDTATFFPSEQ